MAFNRKPEISPDNRAVFEKVLKHSTAVSSILRERLFVEGQDNKIRRLKSYPWKTYFKEFLIEAQILGRLIAPILDTTFFRESQRNPVELITHPLHIYPQLKGPLIHLEGSFREVLECYFLDDLIDIHSETWLYTKAPQLFGMSFEEWQETHDKLERDKFFEFSEDDNPFIKQRKLWAGDIKKYRALKLKSRYAFPTEFGTWSETTITDIETRFVELPEVKGVLVDAMEKATEDLKSELANSERPSDPSDDEPKVKTVNPSEMADSRPKFSLEGPTPPNKFIWNGHEAELQPTEFRLLETMWPHKDNPVQTVRLVDVYKKAWSDNYDHAIHSTKESVRPSIKGAYNGVNIALRSVKFPKRLSIKGDFLVWSEH